MAKLLSLLIFAIAGGCVALFLLLPMTKIVEHRAKVESPPKSLPAVEQVNAQTTTHLTDSLPTDADDINTSDLAEIEEYTRPISGRVGNRSGTALAGVEIEIESKGFDGENISSAFAVSDQLGAFTLQMVPERQYSLSINAAGDYAGFSLDAFTEKDAGPLLDILLERVELVDVDGLIVDTNLSPVADFELSLRHLSLDYPDRIIRSERLFQHQGFPGG